MTWSGSGIIQPSVKFWRLGQIGIPFGPAGGHPAGDQRFLVVRQPGIVLELAVVRIGVPGGHAALLDNFADHVGPAGGIFIVGQREGRDLPSRWQATQCSLKIRRSAWRR